MKSNYMVNVLLDTLDFLVNIIDDSPSGNSVLRLPRFSDIGVSTDVGYLLDGLKGLIEIFEDYRDRK